MGLTMSMVEKLFYKNREKTDWLANSSIKFGFNL